MTTVMGAILAAGESSRMGEDKLLLDFNGSPVLEHVLRASRAAGLERNLVVVRPGSREADLAEAAPGTAAVANPLHRSGLASSLRAALAVVPDDVDVVVVLLGDEPTIEARSIERVLEETVAKGAEAGRARYRDRPGHPVVLTRRAFASAGRGRDDLGARRLVDTGTMVDIDLPWNAPIDIDRPSDLIRLRGGDAGGRSSVS